MASAQDSEHEELDISKLILDPFPLLSLPLELRLVVYSFLVPRRYSLRYDGRVSEPAILQTCRTVYDELLGIWYGTGPMFAKIRHLGNLIFLGRELPAQGPLPPSFALIRSLHLEIELSQPPSSGLTWEQSYLQERRHQADLVRYFSLSGPGSLREFSLFLESRSGWFIGRIIDAGRSAELVECMAYNLNPFLEIRASHSLQVSMHIAKGSWERAVSGAERAEYMAVREGYVKVANDCVDRFLVDVRRRQQDYFRFLDLPMDIRLIVYSYLVPTTYKLRYNGEVCEPAILRTCRQIYDELISIWYGSAVFYLQLWKISYGYEFRFLGRHIRGEDPLPSALRFVRHLRLHMKLRSTPVHNTEYHQKNAELARETWLKVVEYFAPAGPGALQELSIAVEPETPCLYDLEREGPQVEKFAADLRYNLGPLFDIRADHISSIDVSFTRYITMWRPFSERESVDETHQLALKARYLEAATVPLQAMLEEMRERMESNKQSGATQEAI